MKLCILCLLLAAVICFAGGCQHGEYDAPDWPTERRQPNHIASTDEQITLPLVERWRVQLGGRVRAPIIGAFGKLFVGADDKLMYALSPQDGEILWTYEAENKIHASATAYDTGEENYTSFWFTDEMGTLYCLNAQNGEEQWKLAGGVGTFTSGSTYAMGLVFHTYMDYGVSHGLRAVAGDTGEVEWEYDGTNLSTATPMVRGEGADTMVVQGLTQGGTVVRAYDAENGNVLWTISEPANAGARTSGVAVGEKYIYLSTRRDSVRRVYVLNGGTAWETMLSGDDRVTGLALAIRPGSNVLVVSQQEALYALNPNTGDISWRKEHAYNWSDDTSDRTTQPAVYGDYVFHVEGGTKLVARELSTGEEVWSAVLDAHTVSSPTVGGNTVYIATDSGSVYAFSPP